MVEQVLQTLAIDVDNTRFEKLGNVEFAVNSLINASTSKAPFKLLYGTNVQKGVEQLDGVHHVENAY